MSTKTIYVLAIQGQKKNKIYQFKNESDRKIMIKELDNKNVSYATSTIVEKRGE